MTKREIYWHQYAGAVVILMALAIAGMIGQCRSCTPLKDDRCCSL